MSAAPTLLLVDVQEDYLARPGLTPDRGTLVANLSALLDHARRSGWPIVHVRTRADAGGSDAMPHRRDNPEVVRGTPGAEPPPELTEREGELLLFKRFFSAFDAADLEPRLRSLETRRVVIAGTHSHACIRDTADDAYRLGFEAVIPHDAVGSYDPAHAAIAARWLDGRAARIVSLADLTGASPAAARWSHRDPCDSTRELDSVRLTPTAEVHDAARSVASRQPALAALDLDARRARVNNWRERLAASRNIFRDAMVRDIAKPLRDAEAEIGYGLALLDDVIGQLSDEEDDAARSVRYRPRGLVGLITPWNNPFAIAVGKLAPALAYGNAVVWKPALAATRISGLLAETLGEAGLGDWIAMVPGASGTGDAIVAEPQLAALSFTGSVAVGRQLIARAGVRPVPIPVQAELGGSNAAIVDSSADLQMAAADLAASMFSFSGQRCTAVRRVIVLADIADSFVEALVAEVRGLTIGLPSDSECTIGPLIDRPARDRLLGAANGGVRDRGRLLCGGAAPQGMPVDGCWMEPTLLDGLGPDHPLNREEWFGPIATVQRAADFAEALALHNRSDFGLLGALYTAEEDHAAAFTASAAAGLLSLGRARPPFAAAGPFNGWKASGYGAPEHGRWNRDFYTQAQAIYRA